MGSDSDLSVSVTSHLENGHSPQGRAGVLQATGSNPSGAMAPVTYNVDQNHTAFIAGIEVLKLAETYGTPLYVMDVKTIRSRAQAYKKTLQEQYTAPSLPIYAGKANLTMAMCKILEQEGLGLDVVSGGELYTAVQAGFPMENIFFNGNNKSLEELEMALHHQVGRIIVDNFHELGLLHQLASQQSQKIGVFLRVAPGIEAHTHDYIKTGHRDNKFGFDLAFLSNAIDKITTEYKDTIELKGIHAHIGSQIFDIQPYEDLIEILLNIYYNIRENYNGLTLEDLDIGGGIGVMYTQQDDPPVIADVIKRMAAKLTQYAKKLEYPLPRLIVEPGRSLVATSGVTLYTVGSRKSVPGGRHFVAMNGGMGDNIRPALYGAEYLPVVANKLGQPNTETVELVGKYCESGDVLIKQVALPTLEAGDTLMVFGTGAYNYTMSSNYNRIPRPAMVMVEEGKSDIAVRRETYQDLVAQDTIPSFLLNS